MKLFAGLVSILLTASASAQTPDEITQMMEKLHKFPTLNQAAVYAISRAYQCSHYYECGGLIARGMNGLYYVGVAHTDFSGDSLELAHHAPDGYALIADFHTHPCMATSHFVKYFSPQDIANNIHYGVIGILGNLCTGEVYEYDPTVMPPITVVLKTGDYTTQGKVIGKISVDSASIEPDPGS